MENINLNEMVGWIIAAVGAIGAFTAVIFRFIDRINKPIEALKEAVNAMRISVQLLNQAVAALKENNETIERRVTEHGRQIDGIRLEIAAIKEQIKG